MKIYIDILLIFNLYINYFLVRSTSVFLKRKISAARCILAAAVGAVGALVFLFPQLCTAAAMLIKAAVGAAVVFAAFGRLKKTDYIICLLFFLLISFVFGGLMTAVWLFAAPYNMRWSNGVAYFDIPISFVALITAAGYGAVRLARYFCDRRVKFRENSTVSLTKGEVTVELTGMCDTGNGLCDYLSGKPVIICRAERISGIMPAAVERFLAGSRDLLPDDVRLIPCRTVGGEAVIPVFPVDRVLIDTRPADALIGVTDKNIGTEIDCIFSPKSISI